MKVRGVIGGIFDLDAAQLVALVATIERGTATQFSPEGFAQWLRSPSWYYVKLEALRLRHDGTWVIPPGREEETLASRISYAFRDPLTALTALRQVVAPHEPDCAQLIEAIHGEKK